MKYGLWENGNRVKWYDPETINLINNGQYDFKTDFADPVRSRSLLPYNATF